MNTGEFTLEKIYKYVAIYYKKHSLLVITPEFGLDIFDVDFEFIEVEGIDTI
jgi:hypothetical protein